MKDERMRTIARSARWLGLAVIAVLALAGPTTAAAAPTAGSLEVASVSDLVVLIVAGSITFWVGVALALVRLRPRRQARKRRAAGELAREAMDVGATARASEQAKGDGLRVLGYASFAARAQGRDDSDLNAQVQAIISECRRRGLVLLEVVREREPQHGKGLQRPRLGYALRRIADGEAKGLVVADLSRVSRSVMDLAEVLEWFSQAGARLVAATAGLDTAEQGGQLAARVLIDVSRSERERLTERTRKGRESAQRSGRNVGRSGVADNPELRDRITQMRAQGMTLQGIADRLNEEGVPTIRGGATWRPSSVQAAVGYRRPPRGVASAPTPPATDSPEDDEDQEGEEA
jgi:DNA invertase Pin-like site-specific DNA recombinase